MKAQKPLKKFRQNLKNIVQSNNLIHLPSTESILCGWALNETPILLHKQMACELEKKCLTELIRTLSPTQLPLNRKFRRWSPSTCVSSIITMDRALPSPCVGTVVSTDFRKKTAPPGYLHYLPRVTGPTRSNLFFFFLSQTRYRNSSEDSFTYINMMHP